MNYSWLTYALLAAACAGAVAVLAKAGMAGVDANLATAIRSLVMSVFLVIVVSFMGLWGKARSVGSVAMGMIVLSGIAGALSWLFQFHALKLADASKVAPIDKLSMPLGILLAVIFLRERPSGINWVGIGLIVAGAYLASIQKAA